MIIREPDNLDNHINSDFDMPNLGELNLSSGWGRQDLVTEKPTDPQPEKEKVKYKETDPGKETFVCWICLSEDTPNENDDDPLISPCKCDGTMKYIHFNCLKSWLESKQDSKVSEYAYSYYWKELQCELCMDIFPDSIRHKDNDMKILDYFVPDQPYIVLETYSKLNKKSRSKSH